MSRQITVKLTEAQYKALASAVAMAAADYEGQGGVQAGRELAKLNRAWSRINAAWHRVPPAAQRLQGRLP